MRLEIVRCIIKNVKEIKDLETLKNLIFLVGDIICGKGDRFQWLTYCILSDDLYNDLDYLASHGEIEYEGSTLKATDKIEYALPKNIETKIERIISLLRDLDPKKLELLATVQFIRNYTEIDRNNVKEICKALENTRLKCSEEDIVEVIKDLKRLESL